MSEESPEGVWYFLKADEIIAQDDLFRYTQGATYIRGWNRADKLIPAWCGRTLRDFNRTHYDFSIEVIRKVEPTIDIFDLIE